MYPCFPHTDLICRLPFLLQCNKLLQSLCSFLPIDWSSLWCQQEASLLGLIFQPLAHPSLQGSCWLGTEIYEKLWNLCNMQAKQEVTCFSRSFPKDPTQKTAQNTICLAWKDERLSQPCWELNFTSVFTCFRITLLSWLFLQIHVACWMELSWMSSWIKAYFFFFCFVSFFLSFCVCVHVCVFPAFFKHSLYILNHHQEKRKEKKRRKKGKKRKKEKTNLHNFASS